MHQHQISVIFYGSQLNGDSKDIDAIVAPLDLIQKYQLQKEKEWTLLCPEQLSEINIDFIDQKTLQNNAHICAFAYYNIQKDFGPKFAEEWRKALQLPMPPSIETFLERNAALWQNAFEKKLTSHCMGQTHLFRNPKRCISSR